MSWTRKLARPLRLADGTTLTTLKDAGALLAERMPPSLQWAALDHAARLLMHAAETGKRADIEAATDQVAIVLLEYRLMSD